MLTKRHAQEIVDRLALKWKVPPVTVIKIPKHERAPGVGVYFSDAPDWHIGITNRATEEKVIHEFFHYIEALQELKLPLEEEIVKILTQAAERPERNIP